MTETRVLLPACRPQLAALDCERDAKFIQRFETLAGNEVDLKLGRSSRRHWGVDQGFRAASIAVLFARGLRVWVVGMGDFRPQRSGGMAIERESSRPVTDVIENSNIADCVADRSVRGSSDCRAWDERDEGWSDTRMTQAVVGLDRASTCQPRVP